jgi:hypothetical protein
MAYIPFLNNAYFAAKVGIGTTNPTVSLQLGNSTLGQTGSAIFHSEGGGETGLTIQARTNRARLRVADNDSNAYVVAEAGKAQFGAQASLSVSNITVLTNGNVGIGTTSPTSTLHVDGSSGSTAEFRGATQSTVNFKAGSANNYLVGTTTGDFSFRPNGSTSTTMLANGNVGIGTTSPADKLVVNGNLSIFGNKIYNGSASNSAGISFPGSTTRIDGFNGITFHSSATTVGSQIERMRITSAGNVGIGTTSPDNILHVRNGDTGYASQVGADTMLILETTNVSNSLQFSSTTSGNQFIMFGDDDPNAGWIAYAHSDNNLNFRTAGAERMRILANGNVGIGTTNPAQNFVVSNSTNGQGIEIIPGNSGVIQSYNRASSVYLPLLFDALRVQPRATEYFTVSTGSGFTERMRITSAGNVGIGVTSPGAKLQVGSRGTAGALTPPAIDGILFDFHNDGNPYTRHAAIISQSADASESVIDFWTKVASGTSAKKMTIRGNGNVGIGTTAPQFKLGLSDAAALTAVYQHFTNGTTGVASGDGTVMGIDADGDFLINNQESKEIKLYTSDSQRVTIQAGGNVGIGLVDPSCKLDVFTTATAANVIRARNSTQQIALGVNNGSQGAFLFVDTNHALRFGTNAAERARITADGNFGIGTDAPQSKLQVAGGIQMADDTASPSATKVGTMRYRTGTEYVETTGTQLVLNNNFDTDTVWIKEAGWAISGGTANATASTGYIYQNPFNPTPSTYYQITWTISNYSAGTYRFYMRGGVSADFGTSTYVGNGTFTHIMQSGNGGSGGFLFDARGALTASVDNIALTEVTAEDASYADICMQTGASTYEWVNIVRNTY